MSTIGLDHLQDKTDHGFQVKPLVPAESFEEKAKALGFHRDDHYIFLFVQSGSGVLMVEMEERVLEAGQLFYAAYFSRFFRRAAGMPAQVFRELYRK